MTPATVQHVFAAAGAPVVRSATAPQLCGRGFCEGLDYWGGGKVVVLAPLGKADFEILVLRTRRDARRIGGLFPQGRAISAVARGNAVLVYLRESARGRRLRTAFAKIAP